jgi:hypothetical protein
VETALKTVGVFTELDPNSPPRQFGGTLNQGGSYEFDFKPQFPGTPFTTVNTWQKTAPTLTSTQQTISEGLPFTVQDFYKLDPSSLPNFPMTKQNLLTPIGGVPVSGNIPGSFFLSFTTGAETANPTTVTTAAIAYNSTALQIQKIIATAVTGFTVVVTDRGETPEYSALGLTPGTMATDVMEVEFQTNGVDQAETPLAVNEGTLAPTPSYTAKVNPYVFSLAFKPSQTTLTPIANSELSFGTAFGTELNGFDIRQVANPTATQTDDLVFSGTTQYQITKDTNVHFEAVPYNGNVNGVAIAGGPDGVDKGYMFRLTFSPFGGAQGSNYVLNQGASAYISSNYALGAPPNQTYMSANNRGVALDAFGSAYVVGTLTYTGQNVLTSSNPGTPFYTTPTFASEDGGGQLVREDEIYVRKYEIGSNKVAWSGFVGGHAADVAGGYFYDMDGSDVATGSAIALDSEGDIYITGWTGSYDYPRTRNVYGEDFNNGWEVVVSKLSNDGSTILYSTNLRSFGNFNVPAGIAVNPLNEAVISGNVFAGETFPENVPGDTIPSPDQPTNTHYGGIGTTSDGLITTAPTGPAAPEVGVSQSWVNVLSEDATSLIYGSYLGGTLDNRVYGPYVDAFGDSWLFGWTEDRRVYNTIPPLTSPYMDNSQLPASMISANAFKDYPDAYPEPSTGGSMPFGFFDDSGRVLFAPYFLTSSSLRDGWVVKLRVGFPSVQGLSFNPQTIPGGSNSSSTGTVTLSGPAPANGALIALSVVSGTGASFSPSSSVLTGTITIPAGATTGTFTVYSSPVNSVSPVTFSANYLGSFQDAILDIEPYLAGISLSPTSVIAGNQTQATITLIQPAPAGGLTVQLSSPSGLVSFPDGASVTIPAGLNTYTVPVLAKGVPSTTQVAISASLGTFTVSSELTITPATLANITFNPIAIPDATSSTGTVTLNGYAGIPLKVTLTGPGGVALPSGVVVPSTVTIPAGTGPNNGPSQVTFKITVPSASVDPLNSVTVQANMGAKQGSVNNYPISTATGTLSIIPDTLSSFTLSSNSTTAGGVVTGTVILSKPAPSSGLAITISANPSGEVRFYTGTNTPTSSLNVTIPSGSNTFTFSVLGGFTTSTVPVVISVAKTGQVLTQTLTLTSQPLSLALSPVELVGGASTKATVSIASASPTALTFAVKASGTGLGSFPTTVTIPAGSTSASFTVSTVSVSSKSTITVTVTDTANGSYTKSANLTVDPPTIASLTFSPSTIYQGATTTATVTLSGPAPSGGVSVTLTGSGGFLPPIPTTITIAAGKTSASTTLTAIQVSRSVSEVVTATTSQGSSTQATVNILRL